MFVWGLCDMFMDQTSLACNASPQAARLGDLSNSILYLKTILFLDIYGYITKITPAKLASNNKPCFTTSIQSEGGTHQIKVIANSANKQKLFLEKLESKTLVVLTGLHSPKKF